MSTELLRREDYLISKNTTPRILAFDLALRSTGWCDGNRCGCLVAGNRSGMQRLHWIRNAVLVPAKAADLVVLEGYAFSAHASHAHELGELGGVVRMALFGASIDYVEIPPASLKLFATGKGNANKEAMLAAAIRKLDYAGHSNDEVDALWLWHMANLYYNGPRPNEHQRKALAKIQWPRVGTALAPSTPEDG